VSIDTRITAGDLGLFGYVKAQMSDDDRRAILAVQSALARRLGTFAYLEIGSHLGGSLQPFVADARCRHIVSIDPRPPAQPDDRGRIFHYKDNSTARMLSLLARVPDADLEKLQTIELSTEDIAPETIARPDLCFIDGEHTFNAALRDARFCRSVMHRSGVILFHDRRIVESAITTFLRETPGRVIAYPLGGVVFAVELSPDRPLLREPEVAARVAPLDARVWEVASYARAVPALLPRTPEIRKWRKRARIWRNQAQRRRRRLVSRARTLLGRRA
jgi:hypothetical protein